MRVCVTGANGFIGKVLVEKLLTCFEGVRVLSRKSEFLTSSPKLKLFVGDLTQESLALDGFLEGCDVLFNCAGELRKIEQMKAVHVLGTQRLVDAALKEASNRRRMIHFVQLSSIGVYGKPPGRANMDRTITEESPLNPQGEYETTKAEADLVLMKTGLSKYFHFSILRPSNVLGPNMPTSYFYEMVKTIKKRLFFYIGEVGPTATFIHVNDVAEALVRISLLARPCNQIYNLSNDCKLEELIESIARAVGVPVPKLRVPEFLVRFPIRFLQHVPKFPLTQDRIDALVVRTKYPHTKIMDELAFSPKKSIPDSINDILSGSSR